ncbi:hypothetical protein MPSEU_000665800 [Mayamaea pseudoterrestris]|nr:hypothetical protein MPSEU_000665800 [Mayamaea pseudoterrestris]
MMMVSRTLTVKSIISPKVAPHQQRRRRKIILLSCLGAATLWWRLPRSNQRSLSIVPSDVRFEDSMIRKRNSDTPTSAFETIDKSLSRGVFYNVFIPDSDDGKRNARRIVKEQLQQVAHSFAATSMQQPLPVFYYTIGAVNVVTPKTMASFCPDPLECHHMQHHEQGSEAITLDALRQFCMERPTATVTYIHSKGSFHHTFLNERWRRILTDAALSEHCYAHMGSDCNICGAQFYALWTYFFPGNMWTASCDYAMQLTSLETFETTIVQVVKRFLIMRLRKQMTDALFTPEGKDYFGLERYAAEHWVGSHPDIRPCDCLPNRKLAAQTRIKYSLADLEFQKGLRDYLPATGYRPSLFQRIMSDPAARIREYYVFGGMLMKWYALYGRAPDPSSWVWTHHPDGAFWLSKVTRFGEKAIEEVMSLPSLPPEPLFASTNSSKLFAEVGKSPNTTYVFFDAFVPPNASKTEVHHEAEIFNQLIMNLKRSARSTGRKSVLFYHAMRNAALKQSLSNYGTASKLQCLSLSHDNNQYEGETMRQLSMFCQENPTQTVTYIHSQTLDDMHTSSLAKKRRLMRHVAMAAMHCTSMPLEQCSACGLKFDAIPHPGFYGNMFSARCDYINQLLPPHIFVEKMESYVAEVLLQRLVKKLNAGIQEAKTSSLGLGKHALSRWIGSHPSFEPCDMTDQALTFWTTKNHTSNNFLYAVSRLRGRRDSWKFDASVGTEVMKDPSLRLREIHFLPGQLLLWQTLYNKLPDSSSGLYGWYPDGDKWSECIHQRGALACFDEITTPYAISKYVS